MKTDRLYLVLHDHSTGTNDYLVIASKRPTTKQVVAACNIDFDDDNENHPESIHVRLLDLKKAKRVASTKKK